MTSISNFKKAPVCILLLMLIGVASGQTYGTRDDSAEVRGAKGVYSTAPVCSTCGWVESCAWIEPLDPVLVAAADPAKVGQGGKGALALALATSRSDKPEGHYQIHIRMSDGSLRLLRQAEPLPLGMAVHWVGGQLSRRAATDNSPRHK